MKFFSNKKTTKKIIIAILLVMSFNFIAPNYSQAAMDETGGKLFEPISNLICTIADLVIKGLQFYFLGDGDIMVEDPTVDGGKAYYIEYSPGMIFSNKVAALDVNFFDPGEDYQVTQEQSRVVEIGRDSIAKVGSAPSQDELNQVKNNLLQGKGYEESKAQEVNDYSTVDGLLGALSGMNSSRKVWKWGHDGKTYYYALDYSTITNQSQSYPYITTTTYTYQLYLYEEVNNTTTTTGEVKESSAKTLQGTVATWYKALRAIALVGLLSVLVYVGIRMILSSTGQEKSKYLNMIKDWVVAICILFVLQYIMVFTLEITDKITEILSSNIEGAEGQDTLMSDLRFKVGNAKEFTEIFPEMLMYVVLVIYTVVFTLQYLKRLLYMAFFTMIAPLIALTYPLDKIKDGQAQAFSTWIREYIFNALLQPVHLLLYFIFVSSASSLVESNPIYALVAIGFLIPAEKFFRKMFGFEKASTVSQVGAAAGGAFIMNAINKMGHKSGKQAAGKSDGSTSSSSGGASPRYISGAVDPSRTPTNNTGGNPGSNTVGAGGSAFGQTVDAAQYGSANPIKGAKTLAGRYNQFNRQNASRNLKAIGRGIRKGAVGLAGAATLGSVGLAAGIATGDLGNALQYGAAGAGAGFMGANYLGDKATEIEKRNRELYKEGKWGTDEYNTRNSIYQLTRDNDFNKVCKQLGVKNQKDRAALIRQFHSNGITNPEDIKKAMLAGASASNHNQHEIIAAAKINQEAKRYGHKRKDIVDSLARNGINQGTPEFKRAMDLIDQL